MNPPSASKLRVLLLVGFLLAGTFALYWPVRGHDFTGIDDPDYVTENVHVKSGLTRESVAWAFRSNEASNWHPLTWISHMLDCQWFGLNAGAHHLVNVGFHAVNAALLFLWLRALTNTFWRAALVAALFAWHPLRVESVAWVSERKDVLSVFFGLLALIAYAQYARRAEGGGQKTEAGGQKAASGPRLPNSRLYAVSLVLFALSLMSKPMLVTLPCLLLLLDFWPLQRVAIPAGQRPGGGAKKAGSWWRTARRLAAEKIPFFILSGISSALTVWAQGAGHAIGSTEAFPIGARIANALVAYGKYLEKLFWPTNLAVFYPYPASIPVAGGILAGVVLLVLTFLVVRACVRWPWLGVGWFWFLGTLVPVIGLVQVGGQAWADRYSYFPTIGLLIALIWTAHAMFQSAMARRTAFGVAVVALAALIALSRAQVKVWRNSQTLFEHARQVTERNYLAWTVLGGFVAREGRYDEALRYYETSLAMQPDYSGALTGLGSVYEKLGDLPKALSFQDRAMAAAPLDPEVVNSRGTVLARLGKFAEAEADFQRSLALRPNFGEAWFNLGAILQRVGRMNEALDALQRATALMPQATNVFLTHGMALMRAQRPADALEMFDRTLKLAPGWGEARYQRGLVLMELGKVREAADEFQSLLTVLTNRAPALDGLGFALAMQGKTADAEKYFLEALEVDPKLANAHVHYAMMLSQRGQLADAIRHYRAGMETETNQPAALNNLAWILATTPEDGLRNGKDAVALATRACELTSRREPLFLGTLAAAYAEAGDFPQSIATAEAARDLANQFGLREVVRRNEELLTFYRAGRPYRDARPVSGTR